MGLLFLMLLDCVVVVFIDGIGDILENGRRGAFDELFLLASIGGRDGSFVSFGGVCFVEVDRAGPPEGRALEISIFVAISLWTGRGPLSRGQGLLFILLAML